MSWTTENEIRFISELGRHSKIGTPHDELVKRYHKAALKRHNWGRIHKKKVLEYLKNQID